MIQFKKQIEAYEDLDGRVWVKDKTQHRICCVCGRLLEHSQYWLNYDKNEAACLRCAKGRATSQ